MIIQLNWVNSRYAREKGSKTLLHYRGGPPSNEELIQFICDHYAFDADMVKLTEDQYGDLLYTLQDRPMATVWAIFCSYKDGLIVDEEYLPLNEKSSMSVNS